MDQNPYNPQYPNQPFDEPKQTSGMAIAALILGILGFCFSPLGLVALILGIMAMNRIGEPGSRQSGHGLAVTGTVLGGISLVFGTLFLLIALLLPALGAARRSAQQMQNSSQIRGIHKGMVIYAQSNRGWYPGIKSDGTLLQDGVHNVGPGAVYASPHDGDHPAVRFEILMANDFFNGEFAISPGEEKTPWIGGTLDSSMYSYASLLLVGEPSGGNLIPSPQTPNRNAEHSNTVNSLATILSDRNVLTDGSTTSPIDAGVTPTQTQSIWTTTIGDWRGSVGWNDNHVSFETTSVMANTQFGVGEMTYDDSLFAADKADSTLGYQSGRTIGSALDHTHSDAKMNFDSNRPN